MYDFKHQNTLNVYEIYTPTTKQKGFLTKLRNILFYIGILLFIFMAGIFFFNNYKTYTNKNKISNKIYIYNEISHLQLTKAITKSVVKNLQAQRTLEKINDAELKNIIQKVINKIEINPSKTKYSQK